MIGAPLPDENLPEDLDGYLEGFLHRTTMLLGQTRVDRLRSKTVAIAGCGGVGGAVAITLARLGVGGFVLADPGLFDPPDFNRQWAGTRATLGRNKAQVHEQILRQINPTVRLKVHPEGITDTNLDAFLAGADILVDCLDISVPLALRSRVYRTAQKSGMYTITAPIFGFGTMVVTAKPGGMGMDQLIEGFIRVASTESKLPPGFPDHFFGPHLEPIEREIHKHRVPTSAIAVVVATGVVSAEVARVLLLDTYPDLAPPVCLPEVLVVEPWRGTYEVLHHDVLFRAAPTVDTETRPSADVLDEAHHNTLLVPAGSATADLVSDSWSERIWPSGVPLPRAPHADVAEMLGQIYGYPHNIPVFRGRFAEAVLAPLVARAGHVVVSNALFPTTRFHVEAAGARVLDLSVATGPFGSDLDLERLRQVLEDELVSCIWLEPCSNASGGQPLSLGNLGAIRRLADATGVPVVLDGCRVFDNAALLQQREAACVGRGLHELVHELCALSDATATSLTKDFATPVGGFLGVRSSALFHALRDQTSLMIGDGLSADDRAVIGGVLSRALRDGVEVTERVAAVEHLADALSAVGVPVVPHTGGHAVFVDARMVCRHLPLSAHPDQALANALYLEGGVRTAPNLGSPAQVDAGIRWIRCAVPVGSRSQALEGRLVGSMASVLARRDEIGGLRRVGGPPGLMGRFVAHYRPLEAS